MILHVPNESVYVCSYFFPCMCVGFFFFAGTILQVPMGSDGMLSGQACTLLLINGKPISVSMLLISQVVKGSACYLPAAEQAHPAL